MPTTEDMAVGIVSKVPGFIKMSWGWMTSGVMGQSISPTPLRLRAEPMYHSVHVSFSPPPWLLLLAIALLMTFLLARKPKAWQILQHLSETIKFVRIPGIATLIFDQTKKPQQRRTKRKH